MNNAPRTYFQVATVHCAQELFTHYRQADFLLSPLSRITHYWAPNTTEFTTTLLLTCEAPWDPSTTLLGLQFTFIHLEKLCVNYYFTVFSPSSLTRWAESIPVEIQLIISLQLKIWLFACIFCCVTMLNVKCWEHLNKFSKKLSNFNNVQVSYKGCFSQVLWSIWNFKT